LTERVERRVTSRFQSRDPGVLLEPAAEREAAALRQAIRADDLNAGASGEHDQVFEARVPLGWLHYLRYTVVEGESGWPELARAVVCFAPHANVPEAMPESLEELLGPTAELDAQLVCALEFLTRSKQVDDPALLDAGIVLLVPAVAAMSDNDPDLVNSLSNLCLALRSRFGRDGTADDLRHAIAVGEKAVGVPGMERADPVGPRFNLSSAYLDRFQHEGAPADALRAIGLLEEVAAAFAPGRSARSG
jgi:hypothetical protein